MEYFFDMTNDHINALEQDDNDRQDCQDPMEILMQSQEEEY